MAVQCNVNTSTTDNYYIIHLIKITSMKKILTAATLIFVAMTSCNNDEANADRNLLRVFPTLENQTDTKAVMNHFVNGNQIGLFVTSSDGNNYNDCDCSFNAMASLSAGVWTINQNIDLSAGNADIYAYYPYKEGLANATLPVEVASQTDYLFAVKATANKQSPTANITMKHALSLNSFVLKKQGYSGAGKVTKIELKNVKSSGTLNAKTGEVIVASTVATMSADLDVTLNDQSAQKISAIMMPYTITEDDNIVAQFTIDNEKYTYEVTPATWQPGNENTYTLGIQTDSKELMKITVDIAPWGKGGEYEGNLVNDKFQVDVDIE